MFSRKKTFFPSVDGSKFNIFQIFFWKRWAREYLPLLQSRQKRLFQRGNLTVGDVVLVVAENTLRNPWPLGRIEQVFPDKKGFVRRVRINMKSAILERPMDKLVLLEEGK